MTDRNTIEYLKDINKHMDYIITDLGNGRVHIVSEYQKFDFEFFVYFKLNFFHKFELRFLWCGKKRLRRKYFCQFRWKSTAHLDAKNQKVLWQFCVQGGRFLRQYVGVRALKTLINRG